MPRFIADMITLFSTDHNTVLAQAQLLDVKGTRVLAASVGPLDEPSNIDQKAYRKQSSCLNSDQVHHGPRSIVIVSGQCSRP